MNALIAIIVCTVLLAWYVVGDEWRCTICNEVVHVVSVCLTMLDKLVTRS